MANFLLMPTLEGEQKDGRALVRLVTSGIVVAFVVPLFLSLAQSSLVQQILERRDSTGGFPFSQLLVFAGFCIVASFASRAFMDTISRRLLAAVGEATAMAKEAIHKAEQNEEKIDIVEEGIDRASPPPEIETEVSPEIASKIELSATEARVLQAVSRLTLRTATGIARDAKIPRSQIGEVLDELNRKGLVELTTSPNTGGVRHRITPVGTAVLNRHLRDN